MNYQLLLVKYMEKDDQGDWISKKDMSTKSENNDGTITYTPIIRPKDENK